MEKLIVVRHGNYDSKSGKLTKVGEKQIERLAKYIKSTCDGNYGFACSDGMRAIDSVVILSKILDKKGCISTLDELFDDEDYLSLEKAKKIDEWVRREQDKVKNLILASHFSVATGYPTYFMQKYFGDIRGIENVPKGKAVLVDIVKRDYDIIPN